MAATINKGTDWAVYKDEQKTIIDLRAGNARTDVITWVNDYDFLAQVDESYRWLANTSQSSATFTYLTKKAEAESTNVTVAAWRTLDQKNVADAELSVIELDRLTYKSELDSVPNTNTDIANFMANATF